MGRAYSPEEDERILAEVPVGVSHATRRAAVVKLAVMFGRTPTAIGQRWFVLRGRYIKRAAREVLKKPVTPPLPKHDRLPNPADSPYWFENRLTRERLMAGR